MNRTIARIGAMIVTISVLLFAICMLIPFDFGSYFVCMLLPIGYIMMTAGFCYESDGNHRVAANVGMVFAAIYAVLVFFVYFAQTTAVRLDSLSEQAMQILNYSRGGLFFSYDLLGYGMMALFKTKGTQKNLDRVPMEYIRFAIAWLKEQGYERIGICILNI
ncbi:MAG: hypothetical protein PUE71_00740 [Clostridia bacterium]|nr:hypothetical protein [Clostridia bacterium]